MEDRVALVHQWQKSYEMDPRDDSKLTQLYARGALSDWGADEVARELVLTDLIFKNTLYGELAEDFMRAVCAQLRARHRLSWSAAWRIVRFYAPIALKCICVDVCSLHFPDLHPAATPCA